MFPYRKLKLRGRNHYLFCLWLTSYIFCDTSPSRCCLWQPISVNYLLPRYQVIIWRKLDHAWECCWPERLTGSVAFCLRFARLAFWYPSTTEMKGSSAQVSVTLDTQTHTHTHTQRNSNLSVLIKWFACFSTVINVASRNYFVHLRSM